MDYTFYLTFVKHSSIDDNSNNEDAIETDIPKVYYKVQTLIEFDTFAATHGPITYVDGIYFGFFFRKIADKITFIICRMFSE